MSWNIEFDRQTRAGGVSVLKLYDALKANARGLVAGAKFADLNQRAH